MGFAHSEACADRMHVDRNSGGRHPAFRLAVHCTDLDRSHDGTEQQFGLGLFGVGLGLQHLCGHHLADGEPTLAAKVDVCDGLRIIDFPRFEGSTWENLWPRGDLLGVSGGNRRRNPDWRIPHTFDDEKRHER